MREEKSSSRGLTLPTLRHMHKRLKNIEVSERKQVGDAESMFHEGNSGRYTGGTDSEM